MRRWIPRGDYVRCKRCKVELSPGVSACPRCGERVRRAQGEPEWREQVRETVERHKEKKRQQRAKHEDGAKQLSIFPDPANDDEEAARQRRAEIRARVEKRVSRAPVAGAKSQSRRSGRARAYETSLPIDRVPGTAEELDIAPPARMDTTTAEFDPIDPVEAYETDGADLAFVGESSLRDDGPDDALALEGDFRLAGALELDESDDRADVIPSVLATPSERLLGGFIDLTFVALIQMTLFYLTTHLVSQTVGSLPASAITAMSIVGVVLAGGYFLFFWSLSGQTLGKLLTASRVVDSAGAPLGFRRSFARLLGSVLSVATLGAGFIGLWTDRKRRGWHDRLASSIVIRA